MLRAGGSGGTPPQPSESGGGWRAGLAGARVLHPPQQGWAERDGASAGTRRGHRGVRPAAAPAHTPPHHVPALPQQRQAWGARGAQGHGRAPWHPQPAARQQHGLTLSTPLASVRLGTSPPLSPPDAAPRMWLLPLKTPKPLCKGMQRGPSTARPLDLFQYRLFVHLSVSYISSRGFFLTSPPLFLFFFLQAFFYFFLNLHLFPLAMPLPS